MDTDPVRVLVAGGTGTLGQPLVAALQERGARIRVLTRRPDPLPLAGVEGVRGDLLVPDGLEAVCRDVDVVASAAGAPLTLSFQPDSAPFEAVDYLGNLHLLQAAKQAGVARFLYVSVFHTPAFSDLEYVRAHRNFETALRHSGLDYTIVRPTGFFASFRPLLPIARRGLAPRIGDGRAKTNPIHERDLAAHCADLLLSGPPLVEIGGPEVLTRQAIWEHAFDAVGRAPRFIPVPGAVLALGPPLLRPFDARLAALVAFLLRASQVDVVAPHGGARYLNAYLHRYAATYDEATRGA